MRLLILLALLLPAPLLAQVAVTSPAPDGVSVSVYRDPDRGEGGINRWWPNGFALITETRTIDIPQGEAQIRFEGVADSILAESAIVTGLPGGVKQKNRDAAVLSPAALMDFAIGKRVSVRRTILATGAVREEDAIVRAGPNGGVVIEGAGGVEALRCTGLPEALLFDKIPEGLSDKPVLSVLTISDRPARATVTLSYLAGGFDWAANYVAELAPDGATMDLFAWATLANATGQSFVNANTNTIAGKLNRTTANASPAPPVPMLRLSCWPRGTTSDIPERSAEDLYGENDFPSPPPPPAPMAMMSPAMEIVVTGSRADARMVAQQEELGDLKLYRIPEPVTVAAKSQKQVAMIDQKGIPVESLVRFMVEPFTSHDIQPGQRILKTRNDKANHLGLALPSGTVELFAPGAGRMLLAGKTSLRDLAVNEDVEFKLGTAPGVNMNHVILQVNKRGDTTRAEATITSDSAAPQLVEAQFVLPDGAKILDSSEKLGRKDGLPLWRVTVPANGAVTLSYKIKPPRR
ncbi:DUF4139 domain-containing protein [Sphingobium boeckii]|uniref:DUF4139 domain-containing protein n=1 Tax=Sphingobium boeckii TaxID=1082345 RepID=A0A7W9ECG8_9SPHN|nr:hypothetical protein [Sphingobium boeckii]MBB5684258.1 hypothetical protein [Sphingobium boeckii]